MSSMPTGTVTQGSGIKTSITEVDAQGTLRLIGDLDVAGEIAGDTQFTLDSTKVITSELGVLEGSVRGTVNSSKALVVDTNKAISGLGNLSLQDGSINIQTNSDDTLDSQIVFKKSRDPNDSIHGAVSRYDKLGTIQWYGSDGTNNIIGAEIQGQVTEYTGSGECATSLHFFTTANNQGTVTKRLTVDHDGFIYIHPRVHLDTPEPGELRLIDKDNNSSASLFCLRIKIASSKLSILK